MGSYTGLSVDGYAIHSSKSYVTPEVMTIFREIDKEYRVLDTNDVPVSTSRVPLQPNGAEDERLEICYRAQVRAVRDRLDVMGFTKSAACTAFESGVQEQLSKFIEWRAADIGSRDWLVEEIAVLSSLTIATWLEAFADLKRRRIQRYHLLGFPEGFAIPEVSALQRYMLRDDSDEWYGYPNVDFRYFLRMALETCADADVVEEDVSEVVSAGYYDVDEPLADIAREFLLDAVPSNVPVIVLTEGSTDVLALQGALEVLYPHLVGYFNFMNFAGANAAGGAPALVSTIKAFAAAGVANRVIALFDNDTAAHVARRGLQKTRLPPNIRVIAYPSLSIAEVYPTIGPTGLSAVDVNGLAGSIELYFGTDVLSQCDGTFMPVQWRGFDTSMQRYQGELLSKGDLLDKFLAKLKDAKAKGCAHANVDWSGMHAIIATLMTAFSESSAGANAS